MAEFREIQRDRRRRGLARIRHDRHAAARYRPTVSRPGAGSAAGVRAAGERTAAALADRLGHRASQDALTLAAPTFRSSCPALPPSLNYGGANTPKNPRQPRGDRGAGHPTLGASKKKKWTGAGRAGACGVLG